MRLYFFPSAAYNMNIIAKEGSTMKRNILHFNPILFAKIPGGLTLSRSSSINEGEKQASELRMIPECFEKKHSAETYDNHKTPSCELYRFDQAFFCARKNEDIRLYLENDHYFVTPVQKAMS